MSKSKILSIVLVISMLASLSTLTIVSAPASAATGTSTDNWLSTFAGSGLWGYPTPGPAIESAVSGTSAVVTDAEGNVYIGESADNRVLKVTPDGTLSYFAGNGTWGAPTAGRATDSSLSSISGLAIDSSGNVYIADANSHVVVRVTPEGTLSIFAGTGVQGRATSGVATSVRLYAPSGVAVDASNTVYISEIGTGMVVKVDPLGMLTIFAGTGVSGAPTPGPASASNLKSTSGVAVDVSGNVYIADSSDNVVLKVTPDGTLSIIAGTGVWGIPTAGSALSQNIGNPSQIAIDAEGNIYISSWSYKQILKVTADGTLSIVAGSTDTADPKYGPALDATLGSPGALAIDSSGTIYIADGARVAKIATIDIPDAPIAVTAIPIRYSPWAMTASVTVSIPVDTGNAAIISYSVTPFDVTTAVTLPTSTRSSHQFDVGPLTTGHTYTFDVTVSNGFASSTASTSAPVTVNDAHDPGVLMHVAGTGVSGTSTAGSATDSMLLSPGRSTLDALGNLFFVDDSANRVMKVDPTGQLSVFAGTGSHRGATEGAATSSDLASPRDVAADSSGNVYIASGSRVLKVDTFGHLTFFAGDGVYGALTQGTAIASHLDSPSGLAVDSSDNVYIATGPRVVKVDPSGQLTFFAGTGNYGAITEGVATSSNINSPSALAVDPSGNVYIASDQRVVKVDASGQLTFFAGTGTSGTATEGTATSSKLNSPSALAVDSAGNVYIADKNNYRIEMIDSSGQLAFFAGNGISGATSLGLATSSSLKTPTGLSVDGDGYVYISDSGNFRIEMVSGDGSVPAAPTSLVATPGNGSVSIAFAAGSAGGSAISKYQYQIGSGSWTEVNSGGASSPSSITGLTNGSIYLIKLRAYNGAGGGAESAEVSVTPCTTPSAPTALVATPGNGSVSIAFTAGATGGNAISKYQYSTNGGTWTDVSSGGTSSPVVITGLVNYVTNSIRLRAYNAAGGGTASGAVSVTTKLAAPAIATAYSATQTGNPARGIYVGFTGISPVGASMVSYRINVYAKGTNTVVSTALTRPTDRGYFLGGVTKGVEYDIRITGYLTLSGSPLLTRSTFEGATKTVRI